MQSVLDQPVSTSITLSGKYYREKAVQKEACEILGIDFENKNAGRPSERVVKCRVAVKKAVEVWREEERPIQEIFARR